RDLRPLGEGAEKPEEVFGEEGRIVVAGTVLEDHGYTARGSHTRNLRWRKRECDAVAHAHQLALHAGLNGLNLFLFRFPPLPGLQRNEEEGRIRALRLREQIEAIYSNDTRDAGRVQ